MSRKQGLLTQLRAIRFLTRQGIAIRGHSESEGNLQLLCAWSTDNEVVKCFLRENRYTSHQVINELIEMLGLSLLWKLLRDIKEGTGPAWFSIIEDEATDVANNEQMNLSIRWVNNDYEVHEDSVSWFSVPDTKADTLCKVIKDLLIRCNLPLVLCRRQAYEWAANMQGKKKGSCNTNQRWTTCCYLCTLLHTLLKLMPTRSRKESGVP